MLFRSVKNSKHQTFIIATEAGILHEMQKIAGDKNLIAAPIQEDNSCACSECAFMKVNTLEKLYQCLLDESPEIVLPADIIQKARLPLEKMLEAQC